MDDEDISERKLKIASILDRVKSFKTKYGTDDNWTDELTFSKSSADTTEHSGIFTHLVTTKTPEEWLNCLLKLENTGLPQIDPQLLNKLIDNYSQAVGALPAEKHSHNESYAKILVHFAELKAIHDLDEAREQFQFARLNCKKFAFVHTAFAQFELSEGNFKKCKQILRRGLECGAVPCEMLNLALKNVQFKKPQLISDEDKENLAVSSSHINQGTASFQNLALGNPQRMKIESPEEYSVKTRFSYGEKLSSPEDFEDIGRKPLLNMSAKTCPLGRVPVQPATSPDTRTRKSDGSGSSSVVKRPFSSMRVPVLATLSNPKYLGDDLHCSEDIKVPSSNILPHEEQANEDSLDMKTPSSVILSVTESNLTVKRNEDLILGSTSTAVLNPQENSKPSESAPPLLPNINARLSDTTKPNNIEAEWKWKVPETPRQIFQPEMIFPAGKRKSTEPSANPGSRRVSPPAPSLSKCDPVFVCGTPVNKSQEDYMNCFRTPVVKTNLGPLAQMSTPYNNRSDYQQPQTPVGQPDCFPISAPFASSDCIVVKGRAYAVLKQIGTGGSSKVFQVMDDKKHLYAIKYVNLEEADQQTIESYQNEISHLNKLQQHCDKIIRLFDYEITDQHIYMVMECGNIDLNTWLRKKKTINPWERKSYWKNMLEAVHTIHQHGIVHSDLKPANFLIVDGMLKLIDFGIANQIQPDVTSIVKDSQVGTINYMPPESIRDTTSYAENGKPRSKISPKGDVWSLGCILYCMTYGKTPFQHITNQIAKLHSILDPGYEIEFPNIPEKDLQDVLRKCLVRNPKERISIAELLVHPYVQIQPHTQPDQQVQKETTEEMKRILGQLIGLNSPNSISRAAKNLYDQFNSGRSLDLSTLGTTVSQNTRTTK
ncbi:TTK protein kinase S homeolog [Xenopus laevis]|uniref:Dual specificity protein kinase TTK n=1 Tax=Xenopus laevis TaxID=8355 RepID=Q98T92_XENLA|nr:TTK protein kinase S homeolog [Xenopus laevis]AAK27843.1 Mps1/TTK [Xenopus laevis]